VGGFDFCGLGIQGVATEVILIKDGEGQKTQVFLKVESPNPQKFASEWEEIMVDKQGYRFSGLETFGVKGKIVRVKFIPP